MQHKSDYLIQSDVNLALMKRMGDRWLTLGKDLSLTSIRGKTDSVVLRR